MADVETKSNGKKGISLPVVVALVIGAIVLQVGLLLIAFRLFLSSPQDSPEVSKPHKEDTSTNPTVPRGVIVPVEDLVVNPRGSSSRYVLVALGLEVENPKQGEQLRQELMIPVRDRVMSIVSSYSIEELQSTGIRDTLRVRIRKELEQTLPGIRLQNVYFSKFVIQ